MSFEVPCDRAAPGSVREKLRDLTEFGNVLGDVLVVASELTTNAVLHSGCSSHDRLAVEARLDPHCVVIAVRDPGRSGDSAAARPHDPDRAGGLGLRIVERIASDWGAERDRGYRVWAEVPLLA